MTDAITGDFDIAADLAAHDRSVAHADLHPLG